MPLKSAEQLKQKTAAMKKKLADKVASMDPVKVRSAKKQIRRVQRRRRVLDARAKKLAAKATPKAE